MLGPLLFLIYVNDMSQAVESDQYLYGCDSCLLLKYKEVTKIIITIIIIKQWTRDFANICDWFVDIKLSIYFGQDKTKSILFSSRRNLTLAEKLDIRYKEIKIKQDKNCVNYLVYVLGETMVLRVIENVDSRLRFLDASVLSLICNALTSFWFCLYCVILKFDKETER